MSFSSKKIVGVSVIYLTKANTVSPVTIRRVKLKHEISGADPGFFLGWGALISCSTSTPINRRSSQGGGGGGTPRTHPLDPPLNINIHLKRTNKFKLHNEYNKRTLFNILYSCFKRAIDNKIANLIR